MASLQVTGVIKTFSAKNRFGFLACTDGQVEGDIYFQQRYLPKEVQDCGLDDTEFINLTGHSVACSVVHTADGKPQAQDVVLTVEKDDDFLVGVVKSFSEKDGYGFLSCTALESDIYFKLKFVPAHLQGNLKGQPARFNLNTTEDGKYQAHKVGFKRLGQVGQIGGMMNAMMGGMQKGGMGGFGGMIGGMGGMMPQRPQPMQKGKGGPAAAMQMMQMMQHAPQFGGNFGKGMGGMGKGAAMAGGKGSGQSASGIVKSYNPAKGYGFIQSPAVAGDIYFKGDSGEIPSGAAVSFNLNYKPDGKPQANNVTPAIAEGEQVVGTVKSFNAVKGFGFLTVPGQPCEIYFKAQVLPGDLAALGDIAGQQMRVTVRIMPDGKMQVASAASAGHGGMGAKRTAAQMRPSPAATPAAKRQKGGGGLLECTVKSYNAAKKWGFLQSTQLPADIYFQGRLLPAEYQNIPLEGATGRCEVAYTPDGKPQAASLQLD